MEQFIFFLPVNILMVGHVRPYDTRLCVLIFHSYFFIVFNVANDSSPEPSTSPTSDGNDNGGPISPGLHH